MKYMFTAFLLLYLCTSVYSEVIEVPGDFSTITKAVEAASDFDTILVAKGIYTERIDFGGKKITLASHYILEADTNLIYETIISADYGYGDKRHAVRFISGEDSNSVLIGFRIYGAHLPVDTSWYNEAGIYCYNSSPVIRRCVFLNNNPNHILTFNSNPLIDSCEFTDKYRGVYSGSGSHPIVQNSIFSDNIFHKEGSSVFVQKQSALDIVNCEFHNASSKERGGAVYIGRGSEVNIEGCLFQNAETELGGAVFVDTSASLTAHNSTFKYCEAENSGGVVYSASNSDLRFIGCTFFDNSLKIQYGNPTPDFYGGGICAYGSTLTADSCFFKYNFGNLIGGAIYTRGGSSIISNSEFDYNRADKAAAIAHDSGTNHQISNCLFKNHKINSVVFAEDIEGILTVSGCTFVDNINRMSAESKALVHIINSDFEIISTLMAFNEARTLYQQDNESANSSLKYNDFYQNSYGDYEDGLSSYLGEDCNISEDPMFCDQLLGDYSLSELSTCATENNSCEKRIGAFDVGCYITATDDTEEVNIPDKLTLYQNYPNPFNPRTTISFDIPLRSEVSLTVTNLLGQTIDQIHLGVLETGNHHINWSSDRSNRSSIPSGIYFYTIKADNVTASGKMMLLK